MNEIAVLPETKPAYKTTEFWLTLGVILLGIVQQGAGVFNIPDSVVLQFQFVLASAYALARGIAKQGVQPEPTVDFPVPDEEPDVRGIVVPDPADPDAKS